MPQREMSGWLGGLGSVAGIWLGAGAPRHRWSRSRPPLASPGVAPGEALNEHVTGARWPAAAERQEMLEEAVTIIAELLTGEQLTHHGQHYQVETARLYSVPSVPPPIYVSGFGENSARLAARI